MNEEEKIQPDETAASEDEGRPPVDPHNKLYTVISLLIFAVLYFGWGYVKDNFTFRYSLFCDELTAESSAVITEEIFENSTPPEEITLKFARYNKNFDRDSLYAAFELPESYFEDGTEDFAEKYLPFIAGDPEIDVRLTVFSRPDNVPDYVYGDSYVSIDDPNQSCMIYEQDGSYMAVFRLSGYDGIIISILRENGVKIPVR